MKFVFPNLEYKNKAIEFVNEFRQSNSNINGCGSLEKYLNDSSYENWIKKVMADIDIANIEEGRVPAYTYFYVREEDDSIVGIINIRLALNDFLRNEGGHIGYSIRPTERRKGYATMMLRDALEFLKIIGLRNVIISCDKNNIASAKVIRNCGGILDKEFYSDFFKEVVQRYVIR
jgi:predicted acetyltransferase